LSARRGLPMLDRETGQAINSEQAGLSCNFTPKGVSGYKPSTLPRKLDTAFLAAIPAFARCPKVSATDTAREPTINPP
jgi:hypothetical protein